MSYSGAVSFALCCSLAACSHNGATGKGGPPDMAPAMVTALVLNPATATIALQPGAGAGSYSGSVALMARATDSGGTARDVTSSVTWSASDPSMQVDAGGHVTATLVGSYTVTATLGGQTATAKLDVTLAATTPVGSFQSSDQGKLDGTPGGGAPTVVYPLAGSLFPVNIAPIEVHVQKSDPSQTLARITLDVGTTLSFKFYALCQASPNAAQFPNACIVPISGAFSAQLAAASAAADVSLQARLAAADGSHLAESAPLTVAWSSMPLSGGLYYWTTAGKSDTTFNTAVARYDFSGDTSAPQLWLSSAQAPAVPSGQPQCIGCHALSPDGHKLAFSLGGSLPGFFALYDVATRTVTAQNMTQKYVNMTTFSSDGKEMVNMAYGKLTLRTADAQATVLADNLFAAAVNEQMSQPFWSPDGSALAFVSWAPGKYGAVNDGQHITGDMVQGAEIWIVASDGKTFTGAPTLLVPRSPLDGGGNATYSSYYPALSDDGAWVVFDRSSCAGPANANPGDWGAGACDGYNDYSAQLMLVPARGGTPVALANANGAQTWTNSWPRWSPQHGQFRGKPLYWIAYSSRRDYGLSLKGSTDGSSKPQMWFTAVTDPGAAGKDPSFAPVWLPGQDPDLTGPRGNHTPAWTSVALPIP